MRYFDLHCDTMTECCTKGIHLRKNDLHVDLDRASAFKTYAQCYAIWLPDDLHGAEAFLHFCQIAEYFHREVSINQDVLQWCAQLGDLDKAQLENKHCAILTVENASALGGKLENVAELARLGVKVCTLTWNGENELGRGVRAPGSSGLTNFGRQAVAEFERYGIIVDISHASPELFADVVKIASKPIVATHSNAKALCNHPRNLTDEQFIAIKETGGLVGLNLISFFLNDDPSKACMEDVLRHAEHFLSLGGEDVLAIGADWDGGAPEDFPVAGLQDITALYDLFLQHGYNEVLIDKIFFENCAGFFKRENLL